MLEFLFLKQVGFLKKKFGKKKMPFPPHGLASIFWGKDFFFNFSQKKKRRVFPRTPKKKNKQGLRKNPFFRGGFQAGGGPGGF